MNFEAFFYPSAAEIAKLMHEMGYSTPEDGEIWDTAYDKILVFVMDVHRQWKKGDFKPAP